MVLRADQYCQVQRFFRRAVKATLLMSLVGSQVFGADSATTVDPVDAKVCAITAKAAVNDLQIAQYPMADTLLNIPAPVFGALAGVIAGAGPDMIQRYRDAVAARKDLNEQQKRLLTALGNDNDRLRVRLDAFEKLAKAQLAESSLLEQMRRANARRQFLEKAFKDHSIQLERELGVDTKKKLKEFFEKTRSVHADLINEGDWLSNRVRGIAEANRLNGRVAEIHSELGKDFAELRFDRSASRVSGEILTEVNQLRGDVRMIASQQMQLATAMDAEKVALKNAGFEPMHGAGNIRQLATFDSEAEIRARDNERAQNAAEDERAARTDGRRTAIRTAGLAAGGVAGGMLWSFGRQKITRDSIKHKCGPTDQPLSDGEVRAIEEYVSAPATAPLNAGCSIYAPSASRLDDQQIQKACGQQHTFGSILLKLTNDHKKRREAKGAEAPRPEWSCKDGKLSEITLHRDGMTSRLELSGTRVSGEVRTKSGVTRFDGERPGYGIGAPDTSIINMTGSDFTGSLGATNLIENYANISQPVATISTIEVRSQALVGEQLAWARDLSTNNICAQRSPPPGTTAPASATR